MSKVRFCLLSLLLVLVMGACASSPNLDRSPAVATLAPVALAANVPDTDLCAAIPQQAVESALGRKLVAAPARFEYGEVAGSSGCSYDAGSDSQGNAIYAYVAVMPAAAYDQQPRSQDRAIAGIGDAAYFNNGPDARQLWVKISDQAAFVFAIGDTPDEAGLEALARAVVGAVQ